MSVKARLGSASSFVARSFDSISKRGADLGISSPFNVNTAFWMTVALALRSIIAYLLSTVSEVLCVWWSVCGGR
jgi:hypothetical protein